MSTEGIAGYCRACGKALDQASIHTAHGTIYCKEHVPMEEPAQGQPSPYTTSPYTTSPYGSATPPPVPNPDVSPGLAFVLGMIPGVGAIYNGQYAKGLMHVIIVGLLISILSSDSARGLEPLLGLMLAAFWWYMAFEAYHTARKRRLGQQVDEFSSLLPMRGSHFPAVPVILIALGVVFLLNNLGILELSRALRYWPVLLIALGVYMLYGRFAASKEVRR
jgi:LiaI-LiaF-like transmembrane region